MASEQGQQYVRRLRADGLSEEEIRNALKVAGYKSGRVTELLKATRASGSRAVPAKTLPRLYGKQVPRGGWEMVQPPEWVQRQLAEETRVKMSSS